jgi:hypothetical protein
MAPKHKPAKKTPAKRRRQPAAETDTMTKEIRRLLDQDSTVKRKYN